jgi:hypothetical protein
MLDEESAQVATGDAEPRSQGIHRAILAVESSLLMRNEAHQWRRTILDTTFLSLKECVKHIWMWFSH